MGDNVAPVWSKGSTSERLAEIDRIADASERVKALVGLASQLLPSSSEVLTEALTIANAIQDASSRFSALAAIAPQLPETERFKVLQQALTIANAIQDASSRFSALAAIAPQLPETERFKVLEQALTTANAIQPRYSRFSALAAIAPQLPETERFKVLQQALTTANAIKREVSRSSALAALASQLPETERFKVLEQALTTANAIQNEAPRSRALAALAPQLPGTERFKVLEQALTTANAIQDEVLRSRALVAITPHLSETEPQLLQQALSMAQAIGSEDSRSRALAAIAPHLPGTECFKMLEQALIVANAISDEDSRSKVLAAIAPQLPETEPQLLQQALTVANEIQDEASRSRVLAAIAPQLPETEPQLLQQALTVANEIQDEASRSKVLAAIAPQLPETERFKVLERALTTANAIQDEASRSEVLAAIAPQLPETERLKVLEMALTAANAIQHRYFLVGVLAAIAPQLPETEPQLLQQALTVANEIQDEASRSRVLAAIAPQLPETEPQLLQQALTVANEIQDEASRSRVLAAIAPQLPETERLKVLEMALTVANAIQDAASRPFTLAAIAPYLPETERFKVLEQALTTANAIRDEDYPLGILAAIAPHLPETEPQLLQQALSMAQAIRHEASRSKALAAIAPQLPQPCLHQLLGATAGLSKENAAQVLASPAVRFTEALAVQFPSDKHSVALEVVKVLPQGADKTKFLSALVPQLSPGLLPNALRLIQDAFKQDVDRAEAFSNLIHYLSNDQLPEALKLITQSIKSPSHYTTALENLIPCLSLSHFPGVLDLLKNDRTHYLEEKPEPEVERKRITEPRLQARILRAVATTLTAAQPVIGLSQPLPLAELETGLAPQAEQVELSSLIKDLLWLTEQLKAHQSEVFSYEKEAVAILCQLAPALIHIRKDQQEDLFRIVLASVDQFHDLGYQAQILSRWVPYVPQYAEPFLETYKLEPCKGNDYRTLLNIKVWAASSDELNPKVLDETLKSIESPFRKAEALVEIARYPAGSNYQTEALQTIRGLSNTYLKAQYLQQLIPNLLDSQRLEAASVIREIPDQYYRVKALITLSCKFPEFRSEARREANNLETINRVQCIEQLSILAVEVPEILPNILEFAKKAQALEAANHENKRQIQLERSQILVALAPHLPMRINREVNRERLAGRPITDDLWERALYLLARGYRDALQGGSLRNESAQDKDFLNLQDEVNALTDLLLMRDLEPPMTVGILGGWGGGKSYIMHLMQSHVTEVRSRPISEAEAWNPDPKNEKLSPYVGHIYQIKFDAWTFAKSDLWASLMQTIFFELNRQISLEQQLARVLAEDPEDAASRAKVLCEDGKCWTVLYESSEEDRRWFLERVLSPEQLSQFKEVRNQGQFSDELWRQLGASYREENEQLQKLEAELQNKKDALKQQKQAIRSKVDSDTLNKLIETLTGPITILLSNRISKPVFERLNQEITNQVKTQFNRDAAVEMAEPIDLDHLKRMIQIAATQVLENRYEEISFYSFWSWFQKNLRLFGLLSGFLVLSILLPIGADWVLSWLLPTIDTFFPKLIAFLVPLAPVVASAQALLKRSQKWFEETNLALKEYEKQLETLPKQLEERREQVFQNQLEQVKEVAELETEIKALEAKVEAQRQHIPENVYESLEAFVSDRIQEGSYEKRLGLMQQVKDDLAELSKRLLPPAAASKEFQWKVEQLQKIFPRGSARVVVYIDDLDRCPPDRVVQVLEAVQLLVKTPLFIAVLAVDERYITRALEKFYEGVLSKRGRPSGTDYLEKIIQLPYRVRPIMANTLESYLRSQVVIQDSATGGAKFSEFSRQEFNMLLACCQQVDLSPRTLKRLTNVYKLFKIVCRTRGTKTSPQVQQAILALLALSGRYPTLMRGIFDSIETCFEEQRTPEKAEKILQTLHLRSSLRNFFKCYQLPKGDRYLQRDFEKLRHDALHTSILPAALTLHDMTHEIFNLIRSFSFVGEIGEDPEDYRLSELTVGDSLAGDKTMNGSRSD